MCVCVHVVAIWVLLCCGCAAIALRLCALVWEKCSASQQDKHKSTVYKLIWTGKSATGSCL